MNGLFENPLIRAAFRRSSVSGRFLADPRSRLNLLFMAAAFALLILVPMALGVCGCTMFALSAVAMILAASLGVGTLAFGALTVEREKKTLDGLRLTQMSAHEVLLGKLLPEFGTLAVILCVMAPTVLVAGVWGNQGLIVSFGAVAIALCAGLFSAVLGIFLSSVLLTTSQAVVAGWIAKGVWLLLTPMLDLVCGAVLVQNVSPPVFTSVNPLAAFGVLAVPEAASESRLWLPYIYPFASLGITVLLWFVTARRYTDGMAFNGGLRDKHVHPVYRNGFGPGWLSKCLPVLRNNPSFLRELAAQVRAGAGRWPGYLVFVVLFLAPTFYARSWTLNDMRLNHVQERAAQVQIVHEDLPTVSDGPVQKPVFTGRSVHMRAYNTDFALEGHTSTACLRLTLFELAGIALPRNSLKFYRRVGDMRGAATYNYFRDCTVFVQVEKPDEVTATAIGLHSDVRNTPELTEENRLAASRSSLHVGIAGAITLLLLYLSIRFSAFLATAVTGQRTRRTWEDLALTGISAREAMSGKVLGAILLPVVQMTLTFPVLGTFVVSGNLDVFDIGLLYVYAIALSVAAAMLGLWASSRTTTSHDAHLRALCLVLSSFFLLPLMLPALASVIIPLAVVAALSSTRRPSSVLAWGCIAATLAIAPHAISPLTAAVSFMPSLTSSSSFLNLLTMAPTSTTEALINFGGGVLLMLSLSVVLWNSTIDRLTDANDGEAIATYTEPSWVGQRTVSCPGV